MTYPRNAASPPPFVVGQVVQISDGAVQTAGVSARVKTGTGSWGASAGTLTVDATSGFWEYTPTQGETNAESFSVVIYKTGCIGDTRSIATSASATAGYAGTDQSKITNATATVNLSGTTIKSVTDAVTANVTQIGGQTASAAAPVSFPASVANETTVASRASQTSVDTLASYVDTEVAAIKAKTDNLPVDPADASDIAASFATVNSTLATIAAYIDTEVAAIKAKTDNLPVDPADASDIAASFASVNASLTTISGYIDTEVAAIKAKTDNLPVDPADASDIATSFSNITTLLNTLASYVDTEVAAIKAKTDNLPAQPAAVSDIPTSNQNRDAVWNAILTGATYNLPGSAGRRLRQVAASIIWTGTAQGAGTGNNQIQLDTGASSVNGIYDPSVIFIEAGTGAGQCRLILQYNGATRTATVDRDWRINPDDTSEFVIIGNPGRDSVNEGLAQAGSATTITLNANASSVDDCYNGQMIFIRSGTGQDQLAVVTDYVGSTKVATIKTHTNNGQWATIPDTTSAYVMMPAHNDPAEDWDKVTAIKAKTDNLPSDPADQSLLEAAIASAVSPLALEATSQDIKDTVDALSNTTGTGARIVTITVRDSSAAPVQSATVRIYRAGETYAGVTNASGVATFSVDDATFTVAITAAGFSFTPVSLVVSGNVSQTYTLTSTGGVTPSVAPLCTGYFTVYDQNGVIQPNAQVSIQASAPPVGSTGIVMEDAVRTATADNQGIVQFANLIKGATYIVYRTGSLRKFSILVPANAGNTQALTSIVG